MTKSHTFILCLVVLLICLFCATASADAKAGDSMIVLENVNWGDTIEQVKDSVPWKYPRTYKGSITFLEYSKINHNFEGLKARSAQLGFVDEHLMEIMYVYSGDTVFDTLIKKQKELFGEPTTYTEAKDYLSEKYTWELNDGTKVSLSSLSSEGAYLAFENKSYEKKQEARKADPENSPVLFREIEWGSSYEEVTSQIPVSHWFKPESDYASTVKNGMMGGHDIKYKDYVQVYTWGKTDISVAGYPVNLIRLWFVYTPDKNGHLTQNTDDSVFYLAEYELKPKDIDTVEKDLIEKLSSIYGEVDEKKSDGITMKENYYLWYGSNEAIVVLTTQRYNSGSNKIKITYGWLEGDKYLSEAYSCLVAEEATNAGDGNTDGL